MVFHEQLYQLYLTFSYLYAYFLSLKAENSSTCSIGVWTSTHESIVRGVLLLEHVVRTKIGSAEVQPAAQRHDIDVDVNADTVDILFTVSLTLPYRARSGELCRTDCRVTDVLLPLRLSATLCTFRQRV